MNNTEWRHIPGFPDYEVSDIGEVRSWRRPLKERPKTTRVRGWRGAHPLPHMLAGSITPHGYIVFTLRSAGMISRPFRQLAHRLVAIAFLGKPIDNFLTDVAHLNGKPGDNRLENLCWTTHRDNQLMMGAHDTMQYGEKSVTAKLTASQVAEIRRIHAVEGRGSGIRLASQFGVTKQQISRIVRKTRWAHL